MKDTDARMLIKVPIRVMAMSAGYAAALALLERKLRLKPDHEWLEVAIGVGITLLPVALEAHAIQEQVNDNFPSAHVHWKTYEGAIWRAFMASGTPIICWQIGEAIVRKWELMRYLMKSERRGGTNANTATQMASGGGDPAARGVTGSNGSYTVFARSAEEI